ncbi:MAG: T9SS type A sorting domain-containing protein [Ignavibacteriae bacterium]|nr:T9SS C-terminal target domain-containing protein [Ignavibacteriota bacterium]NOH00345.1 T9SS type A sorting domain-containing protein [Ignavibacteriota bacterium]
MMKNLINKSLIILITLSLYSSIFGAKEALHTIRDFEINDGILRFNIYSLNTDEEFAVGPTTFAINYNESALTNPYLTNINNKFTAGSIGYGDMSVVLSGGSILITINHTGDHGSKLNSGSTYGELICTVGLNIVDILATAEISWNIVNSAMFQPNFGLLDTESFNVVGEPNPPLPVELNSFNASIAGNSIELKWQTASEMNNMGFSIERKIENVESKWESIGFIKSIGNSSEAIDYSFLDKNPIGGKVFSYRLKQIDLNGTFDYSDVVEVNYTPTEYTLHQNYPNPFNPSTKIRFTIKQDSNVKLTIYNQLGQIVEEMLNNKLDAGYHEIEFDATGFASGIYFYSIQADNFNAVKKMVLLK